MSEKVEPAVAIPSDETAFFILKRINANVATTIENFIKSAKNDDEALALRDLITGSARHLWEQYEEPKPANVAAAHE